MALSYLVYMRNSSDGPIQKFETREFQPAKDFYDANKDSWTFIKLCAVLEEN